MSASLSLSYAYSKWGGLFFVLLFATGPTRVTAGRVQTRRQRRRIETDAAAASPPVEPVDAVESPDAADETMPDAVPVPTLVVQQAIDRDEKQQPLQPQSVCHPLFLLSSPSIDYNQSDHNEGHSINESFDLVFTFNKWVTQAFESTEWQDLADKAIELAARPYVQQNHPRLSEWMIASLFKIMEWVDANAHRLAPRYIPIVAEDIKSATGDDNNNNNNNNDTEHQTNLAAPRDPEEEDAVDWLNDNNNAASAMIVDSDVFLDVRRVAEPISLVSSHFNNDLTSDNEEAPASPVRNLRSLRVRADFVPGSPEF